MSISFPGEDKPSPRCPLPGPSSLKRFAQSKVWFARAVVDAPPVGPTSLSLQ